jgi:hypothetical protein
MPTQRGVDADLDAYGYRPATRPSDGKMLNMFPLPTWRDSRRPSARSR